MGCLCVVSNKIPTTIERFGESVLKRAGLLGRKTLPCAAVERPAEDLSAVLGGPAST